MQHQLATDSLVPVNIGHVLDIWIAYDVLVRGRRYYNHPKISACKCDRRLLI